MQKNGSNHLLSDYAKVLFVLSITLFVYGLFLNSMQPEYELREEKGQKDNTISITTSDGSEVVPGNIIIGEGKPGIPEETFISSKYVGEIYVPSDEEANHIYRDSIQEKYHVSIRYGKETDGYRVAGVGTTSLKDPEEIYHQLKELNDTLALYPEGLFEEIGKGGIPLTILLIDHYSEDMITGITDSSYSYAVISISANYSFQESFYHESYHYIERYLLKKGINFNSWNSFNPQYFIYDRNLSNNSLSYDRTFEEKSPFVNNYAQTSPEEDRASTFEYMMADHKASCLNQGNPIWEKANYMAMNIDVILDTVRPDVEEYWERFLD